MRRGVWCSAAVVCGLLAGCGSADSSKFDHGGGSGTGSNGSGSLGSGGALGSGGNGAGGVVVAADGGGSIQAIIRDFRFYDPSDPTTVPDFENPPYGSDGSGNPQPPGQIFYGPWDDADIVTDTLGSDGKPVYKNTGGTTLTTHGKTAFDAWYNDLPKTNVSVMYPLPLVQDPTTGALTYDSNVSGLPYGVPGQSGNGFFPIDDGTPFATAFGDQIPTNAQPPFMGQKHNYSFTVEIDTVFTYSGGETFSFRGDDDVFVYIDGKRVINLGGIHGPETANVQVDALGLTKGRTYPLNFFSAERHVTGSNIQFTTTLRLMPASGPPR